MPTDEEIYTAYEAERQALAAYHEARPGTKKKMSLWVVFVKKSNALMDMLPEGRRQLIDVFARMLEKKGKKGVKR